MNKCYLKYWKLQIPVESHYTRPNPSEVDLHIEDQVSKKSKP